MRRTNSYTKKGRNKKESFLTLEKCQRHDAKQAEENGEGRASDRENNKRENNDNKNCIGCSFIKKCFFPHMS